MALLHRGPEHIRRPAASCQRRAVPDRRSRLISRCQRVELCREHLYLEALRVADTSHLQNQAKQLRAPTVRRPAGPASVVTGHVSVATDGPVAGGDLAASGSAPQVRTWATALIKKRQLKSLRAPRGFVRTHLRRLRRGIAMPVLCLRVRRASFLVHRAVRPSTPSTAHSWRATPMWRAAVAKPTLSRRHIAARAERGCVLALWTNMFSSHRDMRRTMSQALSYALA